MFAVGGFRRAGCRLCVILVCDLGGFRVWFARA